MVGGVNIRLDWSRWISEVLGDSAGNATYTIYRIQVNTESADAIGYTEELKQSEPPKRVINREMDEFCVEVTTLAGAGDPDREIYELEACVPESNGSEQECFSSNITIYAIKRLGTHRLVWLLVTTNCFFVN